MNPIIIAFYLTPKKLCRYIISSIPRLYLMYSCLFSLQFRVTKKTQLICDSYPRSGNSYLEAAIKYFSTREINISHHAHAPAVIIYAIKKRIPCVLLIREPKDAIASYFLLNQKIPLLFCALDYLFYYLPLIPHRKSLVILKTSEIDKYLPSILLSFSNIYNLPFKSSPISEQVKKNISMDVDSNGILRSGRVEAYSATHTKSYQLQRSQSIQKIKDRLSLFPYSVLMRINDYAYGLVSSCSFSKKAK